MSGLGGQVRAIGMRVAPGVMQGDGTSLRARFARGTTWNAAGALASKLLVLSASIAVARVLGKTTYGQYAVILSTVSLFEAFATFGLGTTATHYVASLRKTDPDRAGRVIGISTLVAVLTGAMGAAALAATAGWVSRRFLAAPELEMPLRLASLQLLLGAIQASQVGSLAGFEAFRSTARVGAIAGLISLPLLSAGAWLFGLMGVVGGLISTSLVGLVLFQGAVRAEARRAGVPIRLARGAREWRVVYQFSAPAALASFMVGPANWVCNAIIVNGPDGYAQMALFNAAGQWRSVILFLPGAMSAVSLPLLSELFKAGDPVRYRRALMSILGLNGVLATAVALVVAALSPWLMGVYGPGFDSGSRVLLAMCAVGVMIAIGSIVGQAVVSSGRMWYALLFNGFWAVVVIATTALAFHGLSGALRLALANLLAYALLAIVSGIFLWLLVRRGRPG